MFIKQDRKKFLTTKEIGSSLIKKEQFHQSLFKILSNKKNRNIFVIFILFYTIIALIAWLNGVIKLEGDAVGYFQLAVNIKEGRGFSRCDSVPYLPDSSRTPLYPLFIFPFIALFGKSLPILIIVLFQAIIASLTLVILKNSLDIIIQENSSSLNLIASCLIGISPQYIINILWLYSEILLLFFVSIFFNFLIKYSKLDFESKDSQIKQGLVLGFILGLITLTKPIGQFLIIILFVFFLFKRKHKESLFIILSFVITISPWLMRNYVTFGKISLSSITSFNLYELTAKILVSSEELNIYKERIGRAPYEENRKINVAGIGYFDFNHAQRMKYLATRIIKDHWKKYLLKLIKNTFDFPLARGPNLITVILKLDYKYYRQLPIKKKLMDTRFLLIVGGALYEWIYRISFYFFILLGLLLVFLSRDHLKSLFFLLVLISCYFILIAAVVQLNDFDLTRIILPANIGLVAFIPPALKVFKRKK